MATYNLWVTSTVINQIRSNDQDTLVASMGLQVMNAEGGLHMSWPGQTMQLGTHHAGETVNMFFLFENVDVPDPTADSSDGGALYWSFLLLNAGAGNMSEVVQAATAAGDAIASIIKVTGPVGVAVGSGISAIDALARLLLTGCDGTVAAQSWAYTAAQLAQMTNSDTGWNKAVQYPGSPSPLACGAPSSYGVNYTISAKPAVSVPAFGGQPMTKAAQSARAMGLYLEMDQQVASTHVDVVTVENTRPGPGTLVPPGTVLSAAVLVPKQGNGNGHHNRP